ncbi:MAG TPA: AI-2E family transporter [Acidimicrobiales bacterium]|nr:AI-2E family transporter [Acidimicrobiales bacterium]
MAPPQPRERLRISPRSAVVAVALFGLTLFVMRVAAASERVIGWVFAALAITGLLHPYVAVLAKRVPRGIAVLVVAVVAVGSTTMITYAMVDGIVSEYHEVQRAAPARAAQLEQTGRFATLARDAHLAERVKRFVDEAPLRLQGGDAAAALRAAATRGVAFLATGILSLFFLLDAPSIGRAALNQVHTPSRRAQLERVTTAAIRRAFGYARGTLAMALLAGLVAWAVAAWAEAPGPAPLALWVALWDIVPLVGAVIGAIPIVALAAIDSPRRGVELSVFFLAYQAVEWLVLQRWIERRTVRLGPFATIVAAFAGLELYGVGGALIMLLAVVLAVAAMDELLPPLTAPAAGAPAAAAASAPGPSAARPNGLEVGPVGVVEVDRRRAVEHLADEI